MAGVAAMARAGARIVFDDVFLSGVASQERTRAHLAGLEILTQSLDSARLVAERVS